MSSMGSRCLPSLPSSRSPGGIFTSPTDIQLPPVSIDASAQPTAWNRALPALDARDLMEAYPSSVVAPGPSLKKRYFAAEEREFFTRNTQAKKHIQQPPPSLTCCPSSQSSPSLLSSPASTFSTPTLSSLSSLSSSVSSSRQGSYFEDRSEAQASGQSHQARNRSPLARKESHVVDGARVVSPELSGIASSSAATVYIQILPAEQDQDSPPSSPSSLHGGKRNGSRGRKRATPRDRARSGEESEVAEPNSDTGSDAGRGFGVLMPPRSLTLRFVTDTRCAAGAKEPTTPWSPEGQSPMTFIPLAKKGTGAPGRGPTRRARKWL